LNPFGAEHFRAGVSADVDLTSGEQSEESYDPQKVSRRQLADHPGRTGPGVHLRCAGNGIQCAERYSQKRLWRVFYQLRKRRTENVAYQTSRVVRHTKLPQGAIKRLSVSVLVDHALRWEGTKKIVEAPAPEKLKVIRDLVGAAAGLDTNRGDQLVVEAFPFEATLAAEPEMTITPAVPQPSSIRLPWWLQKLIGTQKPGLVLGIAGGIVLALLAFPVVLFARSGRRKKKPAPEQSALAIGAAKSAAKPGEPLGPADQVDQVVHAQIAAQGAEQAQKTAAALSQLKVPVAMTSKTDLLTKHLSTEAKKDPAAMAQVAGVGLMVTAEWRQLNGDDRRERR
jgi:flagellar M-ring protein FliF